MNSNTLMQSHVRHGDKWFFVSTINRESSSPYAGGAVYAETVAWEWNSVRRERGRVVVRDEAAKDSVHTHLAICKRIAETGNPEEQKE